MKLDHQEELALIDLTRVLSLLTVGLDTSNP
jgi:hypothetical protein